MTSEPASVREPSLLLIGDVDYGAAPGKSLDATQSRSAPSPSGGGWAFGELAYARREIDTIAASFHRTFPDQPAHTLSRRQATESEFRRQAPQNRWLHIASHGFFAPAEVPSAASNAPLATRLVNWLNSATRSILGAANPQAPTVKSPVGRLASEDRVVGFNPGLLSGLALAGANTAPAEGQDDGILTALEVGALDLRGVDLAVLSACDTGLGPTAGGEGVLGLQRAFQLSGARTTVTSLWQVHDLATQLLMTRFYANLWQRKMGKLKALREAQLWMLRDAGRLRRDGSRAIDELQQDQPAGEDGRLPPYYWGAFVLGGDWR